MRPTFVAKDQLLDIRRKALNNDEYYEDDELKKKYIKALNKVSQEMVKNWDVSYEKIIEREKKEKKDNKIAEERSKIEFYNKLMEAKRQEKDRMIADAKEIFFKQKDEPRILESALVCAEMLKEQERQREFNKKLKEEEKQRDLEYVKYINKACNNWKQEQIKKRQKRIEKDISESLLIKEQAEQRRLSLIEERKAIVKMEKENKIKAQEEIRQLNNLSLKMKKDEQEAFKNYVESAVEEVKLRKEKEKLQSEKENELIEIYRNTQSKLQDIRNKREKEIIVEKTKNRDVVRKIFVDNLKKTSNDEERYQKAQKEYQEREAKLLEKEKMEKQAKKEEKIGFYEEWLVQEKINKEIEENLHKSEITNRVENIKYTHNLIEKMTNEHNNKAAELKQFIYQQQKELMEKKNREKRDLLKFYDDDRVTDMKAADEKFLSYANQLLAECEAAGRPTYPLQKVIKDYKARYLHPEKKLLKHLRTHFLPRETEKFENAKK